MKKYIAIIVAVFGFAIPAYSQQVVQVVWPYSLGITDVQVINTLIDSANNQQRKYLFIFINKPGAGGTVAANDVLHGRDLAVLVNSPSMYTRPLLYADSYDPTRFSMINTLCVDMPIVIFSKKYRNLKEGPEISVGINAGAITQVLTKTITKNNPNIRLTEIPYKGTAAASMDMMGGQIDASVGWLSESERMDQDTRVIGLTGTNGFGKGATFGQQGIRGLDNMLYNLYIFTRSDLPESTKQELSKIFYQATRTTQVQESCRADYGRTAETPYNQLDQLHRSQMIHWFRLTQGMPRQ